LRSQVLFTAHRDGVFRYLCRVVGQSDAPDLTQEVFLRVARTPVPETTTDGERAWVFRIARNVAINHRRDTDRRPSTVELTEFTGNAASRPASQEISTAMREALEGLQPLDRDVFLFREVAGLSYNEIAISCEITPDAVRSRLHRARQQLRQVLQPFLSNGSTPFVRFYDKQ
jgi:RNA polymerase sigma-70 factor (ECF subfamily)